MSLYGPFRAVGTQGRTRMRTRTIIALAGTCAVAGIAMAVYLAGAIPHVSRQAEQSIAPVASILSPQGEAATGNPPGAHSLGTNVHHPRDLPATQASAPKPPAQPDVTSSPTKATGLSALPPRLPISPLEKTSPQRRAGAGPTEARASASIDQVPAGVSRVRQFRDPVVPQAQGVEVQLREETAAWPKARPTRSSTEEGSTAREDQGPIVVRFYPAGIERGVLDAETPPVAGGAPARSPVAPDDYTVVRRSIEDFRSLSRPLDHLATRYYRPRYLTVEQLRVLIEPLLSEGRGQLHRTPPDRQAGPNPETRGGPMLAVRDRLEVLDRLDRVVPLLDTAPTYVSLEAMVLDIRLSGASGVDFQRLIQKRHLTPAEYTHQNSRGTATSSDAGGLKVAYLNGDINGLLGALGAFGQTTLVATPRLAVRQGAEAEIELDAPQTAMDAAVGPRGRSREGSPLTDSAPAPGLRLLARPLAVYEGGMDLQVRTLAIDPRREAELANRPARLTQGEEPGTRARAASVSIVVPEGVTLAIGGLAHPGVQAEAPPERASFLGISPLWNRPSGGRHELLVLVVPRVTGTPPAELAHAVDCLDPGLRRWVAQQYLRAAKRAQEARQDAMALHWVEEALRFDTAQPAAVELYERLQRTASRAPRTSWR